MGSGSGSSPQCCEEAEAVASEDFIQAKAIKQHLDAMEL